MSPDKETLLRSKTEEAPLDEIVFADFKEIHPQDVYTNLTVRGDERKQHIKDTWHRGGDANLTATLDEQDLTEKVDKLLQFKHDLLTRNDLGEDVKQLYRWKVNEDIANIRMLQASARGDMRAFRRYNEFIYGKPDESVYRAALDFVAHDAEKILASDSSDEAKEAARRALEQVEDKRGDRNLLYPESEVFEQLREDHWRTGGYYALLLVGVEIPDGKITPEVGTPILQTVVQDNLQSEYTLQPTKSSSWEVAHRDESVKYPENYNMSRERYIGLALGHEVGTHLLEVANGLRGPLLLGSIGLDRQEAGGEGRGVVREQLVYDNFGDFTELVRWRDLLRRHITISYAYGLDGGEKASHEVYEFVNAIDMMYQFVDTPEKTIDEIADMCQAKTDTLLLRVLKGTDGKGGAYLKDKVYLEGQVAVWKTAAKRGVKNVSSGDAAKFDISNPRHITKLQKLGVLPSDDLDDRIGL